MSKAKRKIIDFRARPSSLHVFFGKDVGPGHDRYEWLKTINRRFGSDDPEHWVGERDTAHFVERMDEGGIATGVLVSRNTPACRIRNDDVAKVAGSAPGRIIGFGAVDPAEGIKAAVDEVERCVKKLGLKGIAMDPGTTKFQMAYDDRRCWPVYAACAGLGVPVVLMTGPFAGPDISYTHPAGIDRIAKNFPDLNIVAGHACWPYAAEMVGVAFRHPNVFVSPDIYQHQPGNEIFRQAANGYMADQYLFGTGYPYRPFGQTLRQFLAQDWREDVLEKVLWGNAARLLKLEGA
jgi:predicted TIM-barrel fold metal-dependent hydrolase